MSTGTLQQARTGNRVNDIAKKVYISQSLSEMTVNDIEYLSTSLMKPFSTWILKYYPEYYKTLTRTGKFENIFNTEIMLTNRRKGIQLIAEFIASDDVRYRAFLKQYDSIMMPLWTDRYGEDELNREINYLKKCFLTFWEIQY